MKILSTAAGFAAAVLASFAFSGDASAQATRTWVSGVGDDANPCSRTAPCKTFAGAISKTAAAGIINCLDPGGFGAVTIVKSITIDCASTTAGILAAGTSGVIVNAGASDIVTLRGVQIEGIGTGTIGVNFIAGGTLYVLNSRIHGFRSGTAEGIRFTPSAAAELYVEDSDVNDNGVGIHLRPTGAGGANASLRRVSIMNNVGAGLLVEGTGGTGAVRAQAVDVSVSGNGGAGMTALNTAGTGGALILLDRSMIVKNGAHGLLSNGPDAHVMVSNSTISVNTPGVGTANGGNLYSYKNNNINANVGSDGTPLPFSLGQN